ncbi:MAG: hypothetical protein GDA50_04225 [Alphaproteobacteria bacterium GM202ARS2]|nr:hypothetical protein [Alphaproteobacteria bacterium GM202ARS2]
MPELADRAIVNALELANAYQVPRDLAANVANALYNAPGTIAGAAQSFLTGRPGGPATEAEIYDAAGRSVRALGSAGLMAGPIAGRALQGVAAKTTPAAAFRLGRPSDRYTEPDGTEVFTRPIMRNNRNAGEITYEVRPGADGNPEIHVGMVGTKAGKASINEFSREFANTFGPAAIRQLARQLKQETGATRIGGHRVTGARWNTGGFDEEMSTVLRSDQRAAMPFSGLAISESNNQYR